MKKRVDRRGRELEPDDDVDGGDAGGEELEDGGGGGPVVEGVGGTPSRRVAIALTPPQRAHLALGKAVHAVVAANGLKDGLALESTDGGDVRAELAGGLAAGEQGVGCRDGCRVARHLLAVALGALVA